MTFPQSNHLPAARFPAFARPVLFRVLQLLQRFCGMAISSHVGLSLSSAGSACDLRPIHTRTG